LGGSLFARLGSAKPRQAEGERDGLVVTYKEQEVKK